MKFPRLVFVTVCNCVWTAVSYLALRILFTKKEKRRKFMGPSFQRRCPLLVVRAKTEGTGIAYGW